MNEGVPRKTSGAVNKGRFSTGTNRGVQSGILGYSGSISATGGTTVTTIGNIKYHQFNASGSFVVGTSGGKIEVLIVSGGGSGGTSTYEGICGGGGGGAAQVFQLSVIAKEIVTVIVGAGAAAPNYLGAAVNGNISSVTGSFGTYALIGGGSANGTYTIGSQPAFDAINLGGACGGGVGAYGRSGTVYNIKSGGGGGGMGTVGYDSGGTLYSTSVSPSKGFKGGAASTNTIGGIGGDGIMIWENYYCGGGAGGGSDQASRVNGGLGGGGQSGYITSKAGLPGTANTGGGGGGSDWQYAQATGGSGGSGVVIIRYAI